MNRFDRLEAILIHLQSKSVVPASELAERFETSVRTIYRDIRSLEAAGVPVGSEPGRGYFLAEGYRLPPVMFTFEEAGALLVAGKLASAFTDADIKKDFDSALYKIRSVLKDRDRSFLSEIDGRIGVPGASGGMTAQGGFIKDIQAALFGKRIIEICYKAPGRHEPTVRQIEPVSLGFYEYRWHMIAYCHLRGGYRDFRTDRIESLRDTGEAFRISHPPVEEIIRRMFESKNLWRVTLRLEKCRDYELIKNRCTLGIISEKDLGGVVEITFLSDTLEILGKWLLDFSGDVKIIEPQELLDIMLRHAERMTRMYGLPQ